MQKSFLSDPTDKRFENPIETYKSKLKDESKKIIQHIETLFQKSQKSSDQHNKRKLSELRNAMENQPVIFGGGGGSFKVLRIPLQYFKDIRLINKSMLDISNLLTTNIKEEIYTILSTSYGLASYEKPREVIKCTKNLFEIFISLPPREKQDNPQIGDYGITDD